MARGWESKAIEAQQEEANRRKAVSGRVPTAAERVVEDRRRALELTRKRAAHELARASSPAHRAMLEQAIASLDEQLARLTPPSSSA